jgi:hypothetical protein
VLSFHSTWSRSFPQSLLHTYVCCANVDKDVWSKQQTNYPWNILYLDMLFWYFRYNSKILLITTHSGFLKCFRIREPPIWGIYKKSELKHHWVSWKNQQQTSGIMGDYLTFSKKLRNIVATTRACGAGDMCHYLILNCHFSVIYVTITITLSYIVMDKTTKFASHMCHVLLLVWEKSHSHIMFIIPMTDVEHFFVKYLII